MHDLCTIVCLPPQSKSLSVTIIPSVAVCTSHPGGVLTTLLFVCIFSLFFFSFKKLLTLLLMSPFSPPLPRSPFWPSPRCYPCPWAMCICIYILWLICSSPPVSLPSEICQSVPCVHASGFILFISIFYSLDSTYKSDHTVFFFL